MASIDRLLDEDATRADALVRRAVPSATRTSQDELAEAAGFLHGHTRHLLADVPDIHDWAMILQVEGRADEAAKRSIPDLLNELAGLGFAWRDIARLVGVTVPAIRKWRQGEAATGNHRRAIAMLLAFADVLTSEHMVNEVASWMEIPLRGSTLTGIDIYAAGKHDLLLQHAAGNLSGDDLLAMFDPNGTARTDERFEVSAAEDGEPIIRLRSSEAE